MPSLSTDETAMQALVQAGEAKVAADRASDKVDANHSAAMQIIQALQAQVQMLMAQVQALQQARDASAGQTASAAAGSRPATLAEIVERRNALREIKEADFSAGEARAAGYTCADVKFVGYSLLEAKAAGFSSDELRMVGYTDSKGMSSREFFDRYQAGCTNFSGLDFSGEDFSRMVLDKPCSFAGCNLSDAIFDQATLRGIDFSRSQITRTQLNGVQWGACDFTDSKPLLRERFTAKQIKQMGVLGGSTTGYTCAEAKQAGYTCAEAKQAGYACAEAKQAGWTSLNDLKQAGYVEGLKQAGYSCAEAKQAGYTCAEAKQAGYTCAEAKQAGFSCLEAKQAGYTPKHCEQEAGFTRG